MKILITGYKGFIGSKLYEALEKEGHEMFGLDIKNSPEENILQCSFPDVDVVYHLAAQTSVIDSMTTPYKDAMNNILGTIEVARSYQERRIIYTTSAAALNPESPYGISKLTGEMYINHLCIDSVIIRLPNIYDVTGNSIISKIINNKQITFYGNCIRNYIHRDDAVKALVATLKIKKGIYGLNGGWENSKTLSELAVIARKMGKDVKFESQRKGEQFDATFYEKPIPGWYANISVDDVLRKAIK